MNIEELLAILFGEDFRKKLIERKLKAQGIPVGYNGGDIPMMPYEFMQKTYPELDQALKTKPVDKGIGPMPGLPGLL